MSSITGKIIARMVRRPQAGRGCPLVTRRLLVTGDWSGDSVFPVHTSTPMNIGARTEDHRQHRPSNRHASYSSGSSPNCRKFRSTTGRSARTPGFRRCTAARPFRHLLPHPVGARAIAQKKLRFLGADRHAYFAGDAEHVAGGNLGRDSLAIGLKAQHKCHPHSGCLRPALMSPLWPPARLWQGSQPNVISITPRCGFREFPKRHHPSPC